MAQLSKVLKVVCWAGSVPFPPVSLQRQVVCLLLRPVFMCSSQGRAYTVSWLLDMYKRKGESGLIVSVLHFVYVDCMHGL